MKKSLKGLLLLLWIGLIVGAIYYFNQLDVSLSQYPEEIRKVLDMMGTWGPLVYIVMYMLRPLILMPATVLTVASGVAFGPVWGLVYTIIASNLSASVGFGIGRFFGNGLVSSVNNKFVQKVNKRVEKNGFMTVLLMRLLYFPFDLVNFGCGVSTVRYFDFVVSSFIGMLSGSVTFVLLGGAAGSAVGIDESVGLDPMTKTWITLGVSLVFFVGGMLVSKYLEKQNKDLVALKETS